MRVFDILRSNTSYAFFGVGIAWLAIVYLTGSLLNLWPVLACFLSGALLRLKPGDRVTWSWVTASATMGFLLAAYQTYAWIPFLSGGFASIATVSLVGFAVFAAVHGLLLYTGRSAPSTAK